MTCHVVYPRDLVTCCVTCPSRTFSNLLEASRTFQTLLLPLSPTQVPDPGRSWLTFEIDPKPGHYSISAPPTKQLRYYYTDTGVAHVTCHVMYHVYPRDLSRVVSRATRDLSRGLLCRSRTFQRLLEHSRSFWNVLEAICNHGLPPK